MSFIDLRERSCFAILSPPFWLNNFAINNGELVVKFDNGKAGECFPDEIAIHDDGYSFELRFRWWLAPWCPRYPWLSERSYSYALFEKVL